VSAHRPIATPAARRLADAVAREHAAGRVDRRDFVRLATLLAGGALLAGCNARGPGEVRTLLRAIGRGNERLERWLFDPARRDDGAPGTRVAGARFPSYFISRTVPVWDATARGEWRLTVDGAVRRPFSLSLGDLQRMARVRQRVNHYCVEGWNATAVFTGVPVHELARLAGLRPDAAYVDFRSFDAGYHESWDLESALHAQTLVVVGKEDAPLTPAYGAPARVHAPVKLGYKNTKYLTHVTFGAAPSGGYWSDRGYEWYGGT
jgi:DMSO/TMAO reductase YedYZ molybdopterin-dependent catalytic subunit